MATDLKFKVGSVSSNKKPYKTGFENGTIYFANETATDDIRSYLYLNGKNVVPEMLDVRNGGLGSNLSNANVCSVYIRGNGYSTDTVSTKAGAFYAEATNGLPKFDTLPVKVGGTGHTSIPAGALLYGDGANALKTLTADYDGMMLIQGSSGPEYIFPNMKWTAATDPATKGPRFDFAFGESYTQSQDRCIPAATQLTSGVVTTGEQFFSGEKHFLNDIYTHNIYPREASTYGLGSWGNPWGYIYTNDFRVIGPKTHPTLSVCCIGDGTPNNQGRYCQHIYVGTYDDYSYGTIHIGSSWGGWTAGTTIESLAANSYKWIAFPNYSGLAMVLDYYDDTALIQNKNEKLYDIPLLYNGVNDFDIHSERVGGIQFLDYYGTSSAVGKSYLILGNNLSGASGNKEGRIRLYGNDTYYSELRTNDTNAGNYIISLPAANGELVYHTEDVAQGGPTSTTTPTDYNLIKVNATGKIIVDNSTSVASGDGELMYLSSGKLIKSTAGIGGTGKPVYVTNGTLTECTGSSVFSNFTSTPGTSGETLSITVAGQNRTVTLDAANASQGGVVTTGTQTLAGAKTFTGVTSFTNTTAASSYSTGAVKISGGLGVAGSIYTNTNLNVAGTGTFAGDVTIKGGELYLGTSTEQCTFSYNASTDTLTLSFP